MNKNLFNILTILGLILILFLSFIIPNNPYEIVKSYTTRTLDRPLWFNILIISSFIYLIIICSIYEKIIN